jgi:signal transduction histidine kinase
VTALLVALTIYQKWCHLVTQRAAMRQAVQDKAFDVAMTLADGVAVNEVLLTTMALAPVQGTPREAGAPPLTLAAVARYARERLDSAGAPVDTLFGLFRIDAALARPTAGAIEGLGSLRDPAVRAVVLAFLEKHWARLVAPQVRLSISTRAVRGEPVRLHLARERTPDGRTLALYGVVVPRRSYSARAAKSALAAAQWLMGGIALLGALFVCGATLEMRRQHQLAADRRNFVAAVSHELRTPLAHVAVLSETLLGPGATGEEQQRRWLGVIHREAHRLARLVDNVLLYARGDEHELVLDRRWADACEVVREVAVTMCDVARARHVRLRVDAPEECLAWLDPGALRQVLLNLVDNAVKYGPDGQAVTVAVLPPRAEPAALTLTVTLTVDDQGPGIAAPDRRRIWKPFVRLGDRGGATGGSGLGLAVVRDLVRRHGGRVDVTRAPGGGARFVVELPQPGARAGR